jgi:hypothetical protein
LLRQEMLYYPPFYASAINYKRGRCQILKQNFNGYINKPPSASGALVPIYRSYVIINLN